MTAPVLLFRLKKPAITLMVSIFMRWREMVPLCSAQLRLTGTVTASAEVPLPTGAEGMPDVIVPRKAVAELRKLIDELSGEIEISLSASKIRFSFDNLTLPRN